MLRDATKYAVKFQIIRSCEIFPNNQLSGVGGVVGRNVGTESMLFPQIGEIVTI